MNLLDAILGNDQSISTGDAQHALEEVLIPQEYVVHASRIIRDLFVLTNLRVIIVDKQGITVRKQAVHSIPYKSIVYITVENAGTLDMEAELTLRVTGGAEMVRRRFSRNTDIWEMQRLLSALMHGQDVDVPKPAARTRSNPRPRSRPTTGTFSSN